MCHQESSPVKIKTWKAFLKPVQLGWCNLIIQWIYSVYRCDEHQVRNMIGVCVWVWIYSQLSYWISDCSEWLLIQVLRYHGQEGIFYKKDFKAGFWMGCGKRYPVLVGSCPPTVSAAGKGCLETLQMRGQGSQVSSSWTTPGSLYLDCQSVSGCTWAVYRGRASNSSTVPQRLYCWQLGPWRVRCRWVGLWRVK